MQPGSDFASCPVALFCRKYRCGTDVDLETDFRVMDHVLEIMQTYKQELPEGEVLILKDGDNRHYKLGLLADPKPLIWCLVMFNRTYNQYSITVMQDVHRQEDGHIESLDTFEDKIFHLSVMHRLAAEVCRHMDKFAQKRKKKEEEELLWEFLATGT